MKTIKIRNLKCLSGWQYEIIKENGEVIRIAGKKITPNVDSKFAEDLVNQVQNGKGRI